MVSAVRGGWWFGAVRCGAVPVDGGVARPWRIGTIPDCNLGSAV